MTDVLLAVPGIAFESGLVAGASSFDVVIQRRCVDAVELLAAAAMQPSAVVIVSSALPRVSASIVEELQSGGRSVVGLATDAGDRERLTALGLARIVSCASDVAQTWAALVPALDPQAPTCERTVDAQPQGRGAIVCVWGPMGAPGRTTIAMALAISLTERGSALLVDADVYAPSIASAAGLIAPAADFGSLCRRAELSGLTPDELVSQISWTSARLAVVPGLRHRARWPELRRLGLDRIWASARGRFEHLVVDVGFNAELAATEWAPARNAAALSALSVADAVVCVADSSAHGAARLAESWSDLRAAAPQAHTIVVQNRSIGRSRSWSSAVQALGIDASVHCVPSDRKDMDRCWRQGLLPGERGRRSPVRVAVDRIAAGLVSH